MNIITGTMLAHNLPRTCVAAALSSIGCMVAVHVAFDAWIDQGAGSRSYFSFWHLALCKQEASPMKQRAQDRLSTFLACFRRNL